HREPLVRIAIRETAARVAEGEHEEMDGLRPLADPHPQLPEVDLRLLAGAGLEPDGRDGRPAALVPPRLHVPLHLEVAAAEAERPELPVQDGSIPADLRAAPGDELAKRLELLRRRRRCARQPPRCRQRYTVFLSTPSSRAT